MFGQLPLPPPPHPLVKDWPAAMDEWDRECRRVMRTQRRSHVVVVAVICSAVALGLWLLLTGPTP